jgi:uncharacterized protein
MHMSNPIQAVITETTHSPHGRLKPIPLSNISLESGFWHSKYQINQNVTLLSQYELLEKTGRLDNFRRVSGEIKKPYQGYVFNDSDVYKWVEAAAWSLAYKGEGELGIRINDVVSLIAKAQDRDGYLNTYFSLEKIRERWMNLQEKHELYCAGHLIQAAIAHHRVMGNYRLLNVALRLADHICRTFGRSQVEGTSGHPEIEMALVELYRTTNETKYLDQATVFIERRGHGLLGYKEYLLDHVPFRQIERLAGHAVRALYLCCGATDLYLETGELEMKNTLERIWNNMVTQQLYVTGGVGSRYDGEAFGLPYELPNARAYAETCAAIGNMMWNWRMLQVEGKATYSDLLEWSLYNAVLPGISLNGNEYFYVNPLKDDGLHRREAWFECACCPPNVARTVAAFPGYIYSISNDGLWVHHFTQSKAIIELINGTVVKLHQATTYPYDGQVKLTLNDIRFSESTAHINSNQNQFSIFIRIPGWLNDQHASVKINGKLLSHHTNSGNYLEIKRIWKKNDSIQIDFPMEVRFIESHPLADENINRVAISRGPILYCLEAVDNPKVNLSEISIKPSSPVECEFLSETLGGVTRLHLRGYTRHIDPNWENHLYRQYGPSDRGRSHQTSLIAIPYYLWANRSPGQMRIWNALPDKSVGR